MAKVDGATFSPVAKKKNVVCEKGDFPISAIGIDHGHIYGMTRNLLEAGASLEYVWDEDEARLEKFLNTFPDVKIAESPQKIYDSANTKMILTSTVASDRYKVGLEAHRHGKHFLSDKTGFTGLDAIEQARESVEKTGLLWSICFSERLQVESAILAGEIIKSGRIGKVIQVLNIAPHRAKLHTRPDWFFVKEQYGGILCDIGAHQIDQILYYCGAREARIGFSQVGNYNHSRYPEFEDFGDATLQMENGLTGYFRVDWFTPDGLDAFGDGRTFVLGTKGYIEIRKYENITVSSKREHLFVVDEKKVEYIDAEGSTGFPYFGQLILDCLNGTDEALPRDHVFLTSRLAVEAQQKAVNLNLQEGFDKRPVSGLYG